MTKFHYNDDYPGKILKYKLWPWLGITSGWTDEAVLAFDTQPAGAATGNGCILLMLNKIVLVFIYLEKQNEITNKKFKDCESYSLNPKWCVGRRYCTSHSRKRRIHKSAIRWSARVVCEQGVDVRNWLRICARLVLPIQTVYTIRTFIKISNKWNIIYYKLTEIMWIYKQEDQHGIYFHGIC